MTVKKWFEVFASDTSDPPYVLVLVCEETVAPTFKVYDPKENDRLVEVFNDYMSARNWLNEDDSYLVKGREEWRD